MIEFQIDKNIPVPKPKVGKKPYYPFRELEVGDSFWTSARSISTAQWSMLTGWKYSYRAEVKDDVKGYRVWRIS